MPISDLAKVFTLLLPKYERKKASSKVLKGVDVFVDWKGQEVNQLASSLQKLNNGISLTMITNRGVKVWPNGFEETFCTDHWRCRYEIVDEKSVSKESIPSLLMGAINENIDVIKTENLYEFDGVRGFSLGQGQ
jgi:isocitrate dehydrogenase